MKMKRAILIGTIFALIPIIIFLLVAKFCTSDITCIAFAVIPALPGVGVASLFGIDPAKRVLGIAISAYFALIIWFLIGFLGTLLVQWIKSKIKK